MFVLSVFFFFLKSDCSFFLPLCFLLFSPPFFFSPLSLSHQQLYITAVPVLVKYRLNYFIFIFRVFVFLFSLERFFPHVSSFSLPAL